MLFLGLISWILIGAAVGLISCRFLPGAPRLSWGLALVLGCSGALLGGLLATGLGFGGVAGFDLRGLSVATLGAMVLVLTLRVGRLRSR